MKKIFNLLVILVLLIGLVGCSGGNSNQQHSSDTTKDDNVEKDKKDMYSIGDIVSMTNDNGDVMFTLSIDSVTIANSEKGFPDEFGEDDQIIKVTYTYNVKDLPEKDGNVTIPPTYLNVANENKSVTQHAFTYGSEYPVGATIGYSETVNGYYGIKGDNKKVYIKYQSVNFNGSYEFECPIEGLS